MRLHAEETGTREYLATMLDDRAVGEEHRGKDHLALAARAGARLLREGRSHVWVGAIRYVVTDAS
jgi:hypothetical protein